MKKKLVVLLAVVMMFAFSASAYATTFSDVSDRPVVEQDAIKKAVALGIIEGYEDGTFGPDKTITRAEFAKIAVTAAGAKQTATMLEGNASSFGDVRANSWYTGWINAAESLGIFKGDTNGNFRPNDTISNQEAITVMLRLLGYNDNLTGNWPVNYVTKANQIGILDDVTIVASGAAKRGDIVVILGEVLDTDIVTYDKDTNEFVKKQTMISSSDYITLLEDSFDGSFVEVTAGTFQPITQVRDVANKTLNWTVNADTVKDGKKVAGSDVNYIIDEQTAVSYNATGLFDLEGHQGKVYYVEESGRRYVRFIEVESYIQTTTDDVNYDGKRLSVLKTNFNTASDVVAMNDTVSVDEGTTWTVAAVKDGETEQNKLRANSNILLFTNDDDQVYMVAVDRDFTDKAYMVKSVNTNNVRLVGNTTKTVSMNDADTLIWDGDQFIAPSDLEVGDAIVEVNPGELYVKASTITGELASTDRSDARFKIAGKNYVSGTGSKNIPFLDEDLEDSGITAEDVIGNNVTILLNKDNSIAAFMVDETSTGTTLYGIVTSGGNNNGDWVTGVLSSLTIFTQEGYTVTYDLDDDFEANVTTTAKSVAAGREAGLNAETLLGALVAYKLDKDGEINDIKVIGESGAAIIDDVAKDPAGKYLNSDLSADGKTLYNGINNGKNDPSEGKIEIKNNAYIVHGNESLALAANAVIFEVDKNGSKLDAGNKVDVSLVSRSNMLSRGSFAPDEINVGAYGSKGDEYSTLQYFVYDVNTSGAVKVAAFTNGSGSDFNYGVVASWNYRSSDFDNSVTLRGDDNVYDLQNPSTTAGGAGQLLIYTLSGDKLYVQTAYKKQGSNLDSAKEVAGVTSGLISFENKIQPLYYEDQEGSPSETYNIMTDTNTLVYVIDATDGTFSEGSLSDISRGDWAYVPVIDHENYAKLVIVDEYRDRDSENNDTASEDRSEWTATTDEVTVTIDGGEFDYPSVNVKIGTPNKNGVVALTITGIPNDLLKYNREIVEATYVDEEGETQTLKVRDNKITLPEDGALLSFVINFTEK